MQSGGYWGAFSGHLCRVIADFLHTFLTNTGACAWNEGVLAWGMETWTGFSVVDWRVISDGLRVTQADRREGSWGELNREWAMTDAETKQDAAKARWVGRVVWGGVAPSLPPTASGDATGPHAEPREGGDVPPMEVTAP